MKDRLEKLREKLGVQWKELAEILEISVPMMGCLRRGERNPSVKLKLRIASLESGEVALQTKHQQRFVSQECPRCAEKDAELAVMREELVDARAVIRDQAEAMASLAAALSGKQPHCVRGVSGADSGVRDRIKKEA